MSTNSTIAIKNKNGSVKGIYCHWDGYLDNNGQILLSNYKDEKKIKQLIALGSLSCLKEEVEPNPNFPHSFDGESQKNVCLFYKRDRGEKGKGVESFSAKTELDFYTEMQQEYNYLFKDGKWYWSECPNVDGWIELTQEEIDKSNE